MTAPAARTLAIVGGGFSGSLVAIQLLRRAPPGTRILLVERRAPAGRGIAYGTDCPDHLLNVPAGRMSLFAEDPGHFARWAKARAGKPDFPVAVEPDDFLPRSLYGRYLTESLVLAAASPRPGVALEILEAEAVDIEENAGSSPATLILADGRRFPADRIVLALGLLPGEYPVRRALPFYHGSRYAHVPWTPGIMAKVGPEDDVLLVGAGLTAIDAMVQLEHLGHRGVIYALSRRGLRPIAHQLGPSYPAFLDGGELPRTVRAAISRIRLEVRQAAARGWDWRAVIDAMRPQTPAIWLGLPPAERARFMRHVRPFWEVHRHRLPPPTAAIVSRLEAEGRVKFIAGRVEALRDAGICAEAVCRPRGSARTVLLRVAKVVNCTGPRTDYSKYQHPLLVNLLARGLIDHDPLALGINALPSGEVLRYRSGPSGWLFTLGAPLKGILWESTAVPEIRAQAQSLAERLLQDLARAAPSPDAPAARLRGRRSVRQDEPRRRPRSG